MITLVLYFGETHWTTSTHLTDCFKIEERLKPFVSDYKINVIEVSFLTAEQVAMFRSDFKIIADFFVQSRLGKYKPSEDNIHHADEVFKLMSVLTGDKRFDESYNSYVQTVKVKQGGEAMCKVLDDLINEGMEKGMEKGRSEGAYNKAIETARNFLNMGLPAEQVAQGTGLPLAEVQALR